MAAQARIHLAFVFAAVLLRRFAPRETPRPFPGILGSPDALADVIHADPVCLFYFGGRN